MTAPDDCSSYEPTAFTWDWLFMTANFFQSISYLLDASFQGQSEESTLQTEFAKDFLSQAVDMVRVN